MKTLSNEQRGKRKDEIIGRLLRLNIGEPTPKNLWRLAFGLSKVSLKDLETLDLILKESPNEDQCKEAS